MKEQITIDTACELIKIAEGAIPMNSELREQILMLWYNKDYIKPSQIEDKLEDKKPLLKFEMIKSYHRTNIEIEIEEFLEKHKNDDIKHVIPYKDNSNSETFIGIFYYEGEDK